MKQINNHKWRSIFTVMFIAVCLLLTGCQRNQTEEDLSLESIKAESEAGTAMTEESETDRCPEKATPIEMSAVEETENEPPMTNEVSQNHVITSDNYPVMDGSTSMVPLGKAITMHFLGISDSQAENLCQFNRTTGSFRNLMYGFADILVVGEPNAKVFDEMKNAGFQYEIEEIAADALIFIVNENNPVDNLTTEQIQQIYSGRITNWKDVGGEDAPIVAFQRNEEAGSQALIKKLVMKDITMATPPTEDVIGEMGELMSAVRNYDNSSNAIGYSVYYYANDMKMARGLKILKVDGVLPEPDTIRRKEYPYLNAYYCVIPSESKDSDKESVQRYASAKEIYNWLRTEEGQELVASLGYVSVDNSVYSEAVAVSMPEQYSTIDGKKIGTIGQLRESAEYGKLIPFIGELAKHSNLECYMYGFMDQNGRIVSDTVYNEAEQLYNGNKPIPMYKVSEGYEKNGYRLIRLDGSYISEKTYTYIEGFDNGIFCLKGSEAFDYISMNGFLMFTDEDVKKIVGNELSTEEMESILWRTFRYSCGYYLISTDDMDYLLDKDFHVLFGPNQDIYCYEGGVVKISEDTVRNQKLSFTQNVLDESYQPLLEKEYCYIAALNNGTFIATDADKNQRILFDRKGNRLKVFEGTIAPYVTAYGFVLRYETSEEKSLRKKYRSEYYSLDGELLFESADSESIKVFGEPVTAMLGTLEGEEFSISDSNSGKGIMLYQTETGRSRYMEGYTNAEVLVNSKEPSKDYLMEVWKYDEKTQKTTRVIVDRYLNTLFEGTGGLIDYYDAVDDRYYFLFEDRENPENGKFLMNQNGTIVAKNLNGLIQIRGGWFFTTDDCMTKGQKIGTGQYFCYYLTGFGDD